MDSGPAIKEHPGQVLGFDYVTGKSARLAPKAWRDKYPPDKYRRVAAGGETAYYYKDGGRAAEAYAIIPEGRAP